LFRPVAKLLLARSDDVCFAGVGGCGAGGDTFLEHAEFFVLGGWSGCCGGVALIRHGFDG